MNCFNIREIQTLLKARFYADLLNENSQHLFLSRTSSNLRFKLQDLTFLNLNTLLSNRYGINTGLTTKNQTYKMNVFSDNSSVEGQNVSNFFHYSPLPTSTSYFTILNFFHNFFSVPTFFWSTPTKQPISLQSLHLLEFKNLNMLTFDMPIKHYLLVFLDLFKNNNFIVSLSTPFLFFQTQLYDCKVFFTTFFSLNNWVYFINNLFIHPQTYYFSQMQPYFSQNFKLFYTTTNFNLESLQNLNISSSQEQTSEYRFQRLQNPVLRYDFKLGNYMPDENKQKTPFLYTTIHDLTTGVRKTDWAHSADFFKLVKGDASSYLLYFNNFLKQNSLTKTFNNLISESASSHNANDPFYANLSYSAPFYNYYFLLSDYTNFINQRWFAVNALDQKFYKMFLTNSFQQRIHGN